MICQFGQKLGSTVKLLRDCQVMLKKLEQERHLKQQQEIIIQAYIRSEIERLVCKGLQGQNQKWVRVSKKKTFYTAESKIDAINKETLKKSQIRTTHEKQTDVLKEKTIMAYIKSGIEKLVCRGLPESYQRHVPVSADIREMSRDAKSNRSVTNKGKKEKLDKSEIRGTYVKQEKLSRMVSLKLMDNAEIGCSQEKESIATAKIPEMADIWEPIYVNVGNVLKVAKCEPGRLKERNEIFLEDMELECLVNETQIKGTEETAMAINEVKALSNTDQIQMPESEEGQVMREALESMKNLVNNRNDIERMEPVEISERMKSIIPLGGCLDDAGIFELGDKVMVSGKVPGIIRYVGCLHFAEGLWIGVELSEPIAKHNGELYGKRYFEAPSGCGVFVPPWKIFPIDKL